jgi:LacI family transcriptional regulator
MIHMERFGILQSAPRTPRLKDVAREAKVSISTVSAVLGGRADCYASQAVRQRVRETAQRMSYRPNPLARGMRGAATRKIGLVLGSQGDGIAARRLNAIEARAAEKGYHLLLGLHRGEPGREEEYLRTFLDERVDGVIVRPSADGDGRVLEEILAMDKPLVTLDSHLPLATPDVSIDREEGGYLQVRHLLEMGRRRLAFILTSNESPQGRVKMRGMARALREAGMNPANVPTLAYPHPLGFDASAMGEELGRRLLAEHWPLDGIAATSDSVAMGVLHVLLASGRTVPREVALIGFDDDLFAPYLPVGLSSIHQPRDEVGWSAFDLLLQQLEGGLRAVRTETGYKRVILKPHLVVRASSDPAAPGRPPSDSNEYGAIRCESFDMFWGSPKERSCSTKCN